MTNGSLPNVSLTHFSLQAWYPGIGCSVAGRDVGLCA
jgi:hypothetical protein